MNKILLSLMILLVSCGYSSTDENTAEISMDQQSPASAKSFNGNTMMTREAQSPSIISSESQPDNLKMLIKNGSLEIEVKDVILHKDKVDILMNKYHGYYSNEVLNKNDFRYDYNLTARIPSSSFDDFTNELIKNGGTLIRQDINSNDVTDEYRDLELRLNNKMAYLDRYRDILKQANKVSDILEVEEKIRVIEEEVESTKGRIKYLSDQVNFSTLNINLFQVNDVPMKPKDGFFDRIWLAIVNGWSGLIEFIVILVMLWPFVIIGTVVFYLAFRWSRKNKKLKNIK